MAAAAAVECLPCMTCKRDVPCAELKRAGALASGEPTWRCNDCNSLRGKVNRLKTSDPDLADNWNKLPSDVKTAHVEMLNALSGEDWKKAVRQVVQEHNILSNIDEFGGNCEGWMDEAELFTKYKGREDQARNIIKNARSIIHPTRQVTVYEDSAIQSKSLQRTEKRRTEEISTSQDSTIKGSKRKADQQGEAQPKGKKGRGKKQENGGQSQAAEQLPTGPKIVKPKPGVVKKIDKLVKSCDGKSEELDVLIMEAGEKSVKDMLPALLVSKAQVPAPPTEHAMETWPIPPFPWS
eukprot:3178753-Pyramimonas_sp.AAC.2